MPNLQTINLSLRFVLELSLLAALGYGGFQLDQGWPVRILIGLGLPLLAALIWGTFVAPKAAHLLAEPWRFVLEMGLFGLGAGVLVWAERPFLAAALFSLFLINRLLLLL